MKKRLRGYIAYLEREAYLPRSEDEQAHFREEVLVQIRFFQHERLIHLIVTALFAVLTVLSVFGCLACPSVPMIVLTVLFLVLLVPYISHYYVLENGVQRLYELYDRLSNMPWHKQ